VCLLVVVLEHSRSCQVRDPPCSHALDSPTPCMYFLSPRGLLGKIGTLIDSGVGSFSCSAQRQPMAEVGALYYELLEASAV
jgi:hypothetical protein